MNTQETWFWLSGNQSQKCLADFQMLLDSVLPWFHKSWSSPHSVSNDSFRKCCLLKTPKELLLVHIRQFILKKKRSKKKLVLSKMGRGFCLQEKTSRPVSVLQPSLLWCQPQWCAEPRSFVIWRRFQRFFSFTLSAGVFRVTFYGATHVSDIFERRLTYTSEAKAKDNFIRTFLSEKQPPWLIFANS